MADEPTREEIERRAKDMARRVMSVPPNPKRSPKPKPSLKPKKARKRVAGA